jgi:hypothetical protein
MIRLSQGQLNLLATCPRQFQHVYLDQLGSPSTVDQQEHQNWGTRFHLLMQQHELGLPIDRPTTEVLSENEQLQCCVQALLKAAPEIFEFHSREPNGFRQSEHRLTLEFQDYLLTVIYDLLILKNESAQILDWKTYPRPQNPQRLAQNWQTRLYRFVLAETSDYQPEQISMAYWFVQARSHDSNVIQPERIPFQYSAAEHETTRRDLQNLLNQLTQWLQDYQQGNLFPQIQTAIDRCDDCHFNVRCQRGKEYLNAQVDIALNLADVQEIVL